MAYPTGLTWQISSPTVGMQPITSTSTVQNHALGTLCKAVETGIPLGEAEFIYLKGVANTLAGDCVVYDLKDKTTTRVLDDTGIGSAAIAMSANVLANYGWYCISGTVPVAATADTIVKDTACQLSGTAGTLDDDIVAGDLVVGATWGSTDAAGFAYATLSRPYISQTTS